MRSRSLHLSLPFVAIPLCHSTVPHLSWHQEAVSHVGGSAARTLGRTGAAAGSAGCRPESSTLCSSRLPMRPPPPTARLPRL